MKNQKSSIHRWHMLTRQFLGEDFFEDMITGIHRKEPAVDVYHTAQEVVVVIDLPGIVDINGIQTRVDRDTLEIEGVIPAPYQGYHVVINEREKGYFEKRISLGAKVKKESAKARYRRGVLEIRFLKEEKEPMSPRFRK